MNMSFNPELARSINQVLDDLPRVVEAIKQRKDFAKHPELAQAVSVLENFEQKLSAVNGSLLLGSYHLVNLHNTAETTVLPLLKGQISANEAISKMGPLNLNRTIEPKDALDLNQKQAALLDACQTLAACLEKHTYQEQPYPVDKPGGGETRQSSSGMAESENLAFTAGEELE